MTAAQRSSRRRRRWVDPEELVCPGCGEQVRPEPPGYWRVADGLPAAGFSHHDATPLCRSQLTGRPVEPVEGCDGGPW